MGLRPPIHESPERSGGRFNRSIELDAMGFTNPADLIAHLQVNIGAEIGKYFTVNFEPETG
jgi:hypothetical protein